MSKFLDIDTLNYSIKSLSKMIDITFLKKKELFNVTPEYYRLFNSSTNSFIISCAFSLSSSVTYIS